MADNLEGIIGSTEHTRSASAESMALHATMTARRVKHAAQMAVTQPTSRSFLRLPRDSIGNLSISSHQCILYAKSSLSFCVWISDVILYSPQSTKSPVNEHLGPEVGMPTKIASDMNVCSEQGHRGSACISFLCLLEARHLYLLNICSP